MPIYPVSRDRYYWHKAIGFIYDVSLVFVETMPAKMMFKKEEDQSLFKFLRATETIRPPI
jgi:hypothetical protein